MRFLDTQRVVVVFSLLLAAGACTRDPEVLKRQYFEAGSRYVAEAKYAEAIIQYRNAIQQDARFGEARLKLAQTYEQTRDRGNALREAVRAADLMPDNIEAQLLAGRLLLRAGRRDEARARASAALQMAPKNTEALILMGNVLASLKDFDGAIEQVEEAIAEDPQRTLSYANLGVLQIAKGDLDAAESSFRRAVEVSPESPAARLGLANYLWAAGQLDAAERELKTALGLDSKFIETHRALAAFYLSQNRPDDAEPHLRQYAAGSSEAGPKLVLVDLYVRQGKVKEARSLLEELSGDPTTSVLAQVRLAALEFTSGRRAEAYRVLDEMLKREPGNQSVLEAKAKLLIADRKYTEALDIASGVVDRNPQALGSRYIQGLALEALGSLDEASAVLTDVLQSAPAATPAQTSLARVYLRQGKAREAVALMQQVVKAQPRSGAAHFVYAQALLKSGQLPDAERELLGLAKAAPSSPDVQVWLGMLHEAKRDLPRARQAYQRALDLQPDNRVAFAGLLSADLAAKDADAARTRLEAKIADRPDDAALLFMAGRIYTALGDFAKGESSYRRLLQVDPNNLDAYSGLAALYVSQKRLDEARAAFENIARQQERPVAAKTMIGTILTVQGRRDEARKQYEEVLAIDPRAAVAANNLAWDYAERGVNLPQAQQLAQAAKAQLPDNGSVTDTLGWVYYKQGLKDLAVRTLVEASKQSPENPTIHYHLGLAYLQSGDQDEARRALSRALKLNPRFPAAGEAKRLLASIEG